MSNLATEWDKAIPLTEWDEAEPIDTSLVKEQPIPMPMSPVEGASPWAVGEGPPPSAALRQGIPLVAGVAGGSVPTVGLLTGPLAYATTDLAMGKIMGEVETPETQKERERSFLFGLGTGVVPGLLKGGMATVDKIVPKPIKQKISDTIKYGFEKGVRPTVVGKSTSAQVNQYYDRAETAVKTIISNKQNLEFMDDAGGVVKGQLPKNLTQFSQAIDQTKRSIFSKYAPMVKQSGATVDLTPIAEEMEAYSQNNIVSLAGGTGAKRGQELSKLWVGKKIALSEAQDLIAAFNRRLEAFYKNPTPETVTSAAADALAVNRLRASVDSAVNNSGYQALKNQYGALRGIEKEVSNRALVDARKNVKGLLDFTDIFTAAEAVRALSTMSPGTAATAVTMRGIKEYYKYINNPNTQIKRMFSEADKLIGKLPVRPEAVKKDLLMLPPPAWPMPSGRPDPSGITVTTGNPFTSVTPTIENKANLLTSPRKQRYSESLLGKPVYLNEEEWNMVNPLENGLAPFFTRDPKATRWDIRLAELVDEGKVPSDSGTIDDLLSYIQTYKKYLYNKNRY